MFTLTSIILLTKLLNNWNSCGQISWRFSIYKIESKIQRHKLSEELHKPTWRMYKRRKYDIYEIDETWQADLIIMILYSIESMSDNDVIAGIESILKEWRITKNLQTDQGKEFYDPIVQKLMKKYKINFLYTLLTAIFMLAFASLLMEHWKMPCG